MPDDKPAAELLEHTTRVVAAHVSNNPIAAADLPRLITTVHETLATLGPEPKPKPAVSIKQSVKAEYITCLEDGTEHKMLKRHLKTAHGMTPDEYRERWRLPRDYPLVSSNYAAVRSKLAKKIGLGSKGERTSRPSAKPDSRACDGKRKAPPERGQRLTGPWVTRRS